MAKKYKEIKIIKNNLADRDLTFIEDSDVKLPKDLYLNKLQDHTKSATGDYQKLVKKTRLDTHQTSKDYFRNKSKSAVSKQNHSPVYE